MGLFGFQIAHSATLQPSQEAPWKVVELARRHGDHYISCTGLREDLFEKLLVAFGASGSHPTVCQLCRQACRIETVLCSEALSVEDGSQEDAISAAERIQIGLIEEAATSRQGAWLEGDHDAALGELFT